MNYTVVVVLPNESSNLDFKVEDARALSEIVDSELDGTLFAQIGNKVFRTDTILRVEEVEQ